MAVSTVWTRAVLSGPTGIPISYSSGSAPHASPRKRERFAVYTFFGTILFFPLVAVVAGIAWAVEAQCGLRHGHAVPARFGDRGPVCTAPADRCPRICLLIICIGGSRPGNGATAAARNRARYRVLPRQNAPAFAQTAVPRTLVAAAAAPVAAIVVAVVVAATARGVAIPVEAAKMVAARFCSSFWWWLSSC